MTESSFRVSESTFKSEKNSKFENDSKILQSPNSSVLLKDLLSECSKTNQNVSPNSQLSTSLPAAVVRPETRHHLIDVHGLALFLRKATRCIQCFKTGCLSMMGNISRQQPPCVTKITIKCQLCSFILEEDLKKSKVNLNIDNSPSNDGLITSPKENLSSCSLEEVWVEETQKDSSLKERDLPRKKKRKYSHNEDPLQASKNDDTLQGTDVSSFNCSFRKKNSNSEVSKINNRSTASDKNKSIEETSRKGTNLLEENEVKLKGIFTSNKNFKDFKRKRSFSMDENVSVVCENSDVDGSESKSRSSLDSSSIAKPINDDKGDVCDTSFSASYKDTSFITKVHGISSLSNMQVQCEQGSLQTSVIAKIIEEFEKVHTNFSSKIQNKASQKFSNDKLENENSNVKTSEFKNEFPSKRFQYLDSITVENLNVSNINFQNSSSFPLSQPQSSGNNPELRDARIIRKLINLTESLKEELIERKKEIETSVLETTENSTTNIKTKKETETSDLETIENYKSNIKIKEIETSDLETNVNSTTNIKIKKEIETSDLETNENSKSDIKGKKETVDTFGERTETSQINIPEFITLNTFNEENEPELIIPDIYIKNENVFFDAPTTDTHDSNLSDYDEPTTNAASSDASKFDYESDDSEFDSDEKVTKNLPFVSKSFSGI